MHLMIHKSSLEIRLLTTFLNPRKEPRKVRGREIPNQRHSKARKAVKGMAADEPAPHRNRLST